MEKLDIVRSELEQALRRLAMERGEVYASTITHLVITNFERGRVENFIGNGSSSDAAAYVNLVVVEYDNQNEYVAQVQVEKATAVWEPLFEQLQKWAYNLIRSRLQSNRHAERMQHAVNCATDAGVAIVNSYFPYDTAFEAWTYVLLRYTVNKYVRQLPGFNNKVPLNPIPLEQWPDWLPNLADPHAQRAMKRYELQELLGQAVAKLPAGQKEVIVLLFGDEAYSYKEIAEITGRSLSALHKAKFDALEKLRKILYQTAYIYE